MKIRLDTFFQAPLKGLIYHLKPTDFCEKTAPNTYHKYLHTDYQTTRGDILILLHLFSMISIPMGNIQFHFSKSYNEQFYRLIQYYMCYQTS